MKSKKFTNINKYISKKKVYNDPITKTLKSFNIPFINDNISKLSSELKFLNKMIIRIYDISKSRLSDTDIKNKIKNLRDKDNNTIINNYGADIILNKIYQIDQNIISHMSGGDKTEDKKDDKKDDKKNDKKGYNPNLIGKWSDEISSKKINEWIQQVLSSLTNGRLKISLNDQGFNDNSNNDTNNNSENSSCKELEKKKTEFWIKCTQKKILKHIFNRWKPIQLLLLLISEGIFPISTIANIINICIALFKGDKEMAIILFFSGILLGIGSLIKFGLLAYDTHRIIDILQQSIKE